MEDEEKPVPEEETPDPEEEEEETPPTEDEEKQEESEDDARITELLSVATEIRDLLKDLKEKITPKETVTYGY